jgi:hypothetical protein
MLLFFEVEGKKKKGKGKERRKKRNQFCIFMAEL